MNVWLTKHIRRDDALVAVWLVIIYPALAVISDSIPGISPHSAAGHAMAIIYFFFASAALAMYAVCTVVSAIRNARDVKNVFAVYAALVIGCIEYLIIGLATFTADSQKSNVIVYMMLVLLLTLIAVTLARVITIFYRLAAHRTDDIQKESAVLKYGAGPFYIVSAQSGASGIAYFLCDVPKFAGVMHQPLTFTTLPVLAMGLGAVLPYTMLIFFFGIAVPHYALMSRKERTRASWFKRYLIFMCGMLICTGVMFILGRFRSW